MFSGFMLLQVIWDTTNVNGTRRIDGFQATSVNYTVVGAEVYLQLVKFIIFANFIGQSAKVQHYIYKICTSRKQFTESLATSPGR